MPFKMSDLAPSFLQHTVQSMYRFEAKLTHMPDILQEQEMQDFYNAFMAI